jgi:hypothetical protein
MLPVKATQNLVPGLKVTYSYFEQFAKEVECIFELLLLRLFKSATVFKINGLVNSIEMEDDAPSSRSRSRIHWILQEPILCRVTRLGEFSPKESLFTLGRNMKIIEKGHTFGLLYSMIRLI